MIKATTLNEIQERIIQIEKAAHVTFYIVRHNLHEDWFQVYSESKDQGLQLLNNDGRPTTDELMTFHFTLEDAANTVQEASQRLEEIIERKRNGTPTAKQVYFLFTHKIVTLGINWPPKTA